MPPRHPVKHPAYPWLPAEARAFPADFLPQQAVEKRPTACRHFRTIRYAYTNINLMHFDSSLAVGT